MTLKWKLYEELIDSVPRNIKVEKCVVGARWIAVKSEGAVGLAMRMHDIMPSTPLTGKITGMKLSDLASYIRSWDFHEASLGLAAVNAFNNSPFRHNDLLSNTDEKAGASSIFDLVKNEIEGKAVTVVGHFPNIEKLEQYCKLSVLERKPSGKDFPDPACEYILPEQDFLFVTAVTIINKTLPRLLELAEKATVFLVGPSTTLNNLIYNHGVDVLAGSIITEPEKALNMFSEGACIRELGKAISFVRKNR